MDSVDLMSLKEGKYLHCSLEEDGGREARRQSQRDGQMTTYVYH